MLKNINIKSSYNIFLSLYKNCYSISACRINRFHINSFFRIQAEIYIQEMAKEIDKKNNITYNFIINTKHYEIVKSRKNDPTKEEKSSEKKGGGVKENTPILLLQGPYSPLPQSTCGFRRRSLGKGETHVASFYSCFVLFFCFFSKAELHFCFQDTGSFPSMDISSLFTFILYVCLCSNFSLS